MSDKSRRQAAQQARQAKIKHNEQLVLKQQQDINTLTNDLESLKDLKSLKDELAELHVAIRNMQPTAKELVKTEPLDQCTPEETLIRTKSNRLFKGFYI
jgi:hypothetical protein